MSKKKATAISLPLSRTAKIMTSAVGVESVNPDIVALATKATEIFLMDFARRAYDQIPDEEFRSNSLEYDDIQRLVHSDSRYDFLIDSTPKRIKFSEALKLVQEAKERETIRKEEEAKWLEERRKESEKRKLESKLKQEAKKTQEQPEEELIQQIDGIDQNDKEEEQQAQKNPGESSIANLIKAEKMNDSPEGPEVKAEPL